MKTLSPFPQAWVTTILRSVAMNGTTSVSPCKWTHAVFVPLWLGDCTRLNVHTVTRAGIAFHVKAAPLYVCTTCGFFIHPSTDTSFPLLGCYALCCYDAIVQTSLQVLLSVPPKWPKVKLLSHMVVPFLMLWEWLHSPMVVLTCHGPSVYGLSAQPTLSDQGGSSSKGARSKHKMPLLSKSVGLLHINWGFRHTEGIRTGVNPTIKQSLHPGSFRETAPIIISYLLSFPCYKV